MNLADFLTGLTSFYTALQGAFSELSKNQISLTIPADLPQILVRLTDSINNADYSAIFDELDLLSALELTGTLKDEIESLIEAVQIMNYDNAKEITERLLKGDVMEAI